MLGTTENAPTACNLPFPGASSELPDASIPLSLQFSIPSSPVPSNLPTFRCFKVWISQTCLCEAQRLLAWITAVQLVTSTGEIRGTLHATMFLTSLWPIFPNSTEAFLQNFQEHFHMITHISLGLHIRELSNLFKVIALVNDKRWMNHTQWPWGRAPDAELSSYARMMLLTYHGQDSHFELLFE